MRVFFVFSCKIIDTFVGIDLLRIEKKIYMQYSARSFLVQDEELLKISSFILNNMMNYLVLVIDL